MSFESFVADQAKACGGKVTKVLSETFLQLSFNTEAGDELVFVNYGVPQADALPVMIFFSRGTTVPEDPQFFSELSAALLERNAGLQLGYWTIQAQGDARIFTFFVTQIAESLQPSVFRAAINAVLSERAFMKQIQKTR